MEDAKDMGDIGKFDVCSPHNFNYQVFEESAINLLKEICKMYSNKKKLEEILKKSNLKDDKELDLKNKKNFFEEQVKKQSKKLELLYEDRLEEIITVEAYIEKAKIIKNTIKEYQEKINNISRELSGEEEEKDKNLDNLVNEFLSLEKPTKEIIREFIERIEIHSDKEVDIYFNFKSLQNINDNLEKVFVAKKKYEKKCQ